MQAVDPKALFRLSVLGPLVSRERLERGELQRILRDLAQREYAIPGSRRRHLGEKTIEAWFYAYRRQGLDGLLPKRRTDRGQCKLPAPVQDAILAAKRDQPRRSIRQLRDLLIRAGLVATGQLSRSAIHRLLQQHGLSRPVGAASTPDEKRSYVTQFAGSVWYGDVLHGPSITVAGRQRKTYLVSLMDDASRLIAHSAFTLCETALAIEGVLKQALLKRGVPLKLVVDNGAAYRAQTLQGICARLGIQLIHCRPYAPEGKGKLERWHRTVRDQFLSELELARLTGLDDLNARLWAWLEQVYHQRPHGGLAAGVTPLARYQQDLPRIRSLGARAAVLDALFWHRVRRYVRRDGTVAYLGGRFEVPYELAGKTVLLVVDPHLGQVVGIENDAGESLGRATVLDAVANSQRRRRSGSAAPPVGPAAATRLNPVELAHRQYYGDAEG